MAKLSRAKKQPVLPKDLSSLQGIVDEMKNRLSRAVAVVSVFTMYDMLFLCHSLGTGQMFWHWSQGETTTKKIFPTGPN